VLELRGVGDWYLEAVHPGPAVPPIHPIPLLASRRSGCAVTNAPSA
jgi:hypothetical protein